VVRRFGSQALHGSARAQRLLGLRMDPLPSSSERAPVRLAIVGTGIMAHRHARAFAALAPNCEVVAAMDIVPERAQAFAREFGIPRVFTRVDRMLAESDCNAVAIVTPDATHAPLAVQCLQAGRHVLCEKPLALNCTEAEQMVAAARQAGTINLVNFTYRNWPALQGVAAAVQGGEIGAVRHVEASYLQCWLSSRIWGDWRTTPAWLWRLSRAHGSNGVLADIGVHVIDFATYPAGRLSEVFCRLKVFGKAPGDRLGDYVLDANDSAVMTVTFQNGALGTLHTTRWASGHADRLYLKIHGTRGAVEIDSERSVDRFRLCAGAGLDRAEWQEVAAPSTPTNYERFVRAIVRGEPDQPDFARGAEVQKVLDACFASDETGRPVSLG
jgi:predicted dehydrogenase